VKITNQAMLYPFNWWLVTANCVLQDTFTNNYMYQNLFCVSSMTVTCSYYWLQRELCANADELPFNALLNYPCTRKFSSSGQKLDEYRPLFPQIIMWHTARFFSNCYAKKFARTKIEILTSHLHYFCIILFINILHNFFEQNGFSQKLWFMWNI